MRKSKVQMTMAALMAVMLLGGCGEAPYELTEKEEDVIVNYAAHVVTKFNSYQKEGLTYVDLEDTEETAGEEGDAKDAPVSDTPESDAPEDHVPESENTTGGEASGLESVGITASLADLFGAPGLQIDYVGARLSESYIEDSYFAMYPDEGKQYLILGIDITNVGETAADVSYLTEASSFRVSVNHEITSSAETTILPEDFAVYEGTLQPGETAETILLFQVPVSVSSVNSLDLVVSAGENYRIILENE